nr:MAG TPA: hypothetical protein [Caudoviricetes sp.]
MTEIKEEKKTTKKTSKPKKVEEVKTEKVVEEVVERKTYRQLRNELRTLKDHIEVEIVNLNAGETYYRDKDGREVFRLTKPSDKEYILLADIYDIANRHSGYFSDHIIAITDVVSDEYDLEDILEYLNLKEIYNDIERYDTDYIDHILNKLDINKFERIVESCDEKLVNSLSARAVKLYRERKFDSRLKEEILAKRLNRDSLFM